MPGRKRADPATIIALLWRAPQPRTPRGPRPGSSLDELVQAAVEIADGEGLDAVTVRRVAERLGLAVMSVYTYVPGKAELFALMVDLVHQRMERCRPRESRWRARVAAVADDNRALYARHPWLVTLPPNRPPLGPGTIAKYEYELAAFERARLGDVETDAALGFVLGFVEACAHAAARASAAERDSAQSDAEWWTLHEPALHRVFDPTKYPIATRIGSAAGEHHQGTYDPDFAYRFGLERVLDGLEKLVRRGRRRSDA